MSEPFPDAARHAVGKGYQPQRVKRSVGQPGRVVESQPGSHLRADRFELLPGWMAEGGPPLDPLPERQRLERFHTRRGGLPVGAARRGRWDLRWDHVDEGGPSSLTAVHGDDCGSRVGALVGHAGK